MKKQRLVFGFAVLLIAAIFALVGCGGGAGDPALEEEDDTLVISGTLTQSGGSPSRRQAVPEREISRALAPEAASQTFSAELDSDGKTLSGRLKDGSITFELSGEYDSSSKMFSMQAPSSLMIFSIAGKLKTDDTIDAASTVASVKIKDGGEWSEINLSVAAGEETVEGEVTADMTDVTYIPRYCQGIFTDQLLGMKFIITGNSLTMIDYNDVQDMTVVEVTNYDGSPANETGPWLFIIRARYEDTPYTGKFYVSKTFDSTLKSAIGNAQVSDLYWGNVEPELVGVTLNQGISQLEGGIKAFVSAYCGSNNVDWDVYPGNGYSPVFIGAAATSNAKAATKIGAYSSFTLVLN